VGRAADTRTAWHATTRAKLDSILAQGLVPASGADQFDTFSDQWHWPAHLAHRYPARPVYVALHEPVSWMVEWHTDNGDEPVLIEADITGLDLLPDIPTFLDFDVSAVEGGMHLPELWREHELLWELEAHVGAGDIIAWEQLDEVASLMIAMTHTAAVCETIKPERLQVVDWRSMWPHHWDCLWDPAALEG
jgi:hypothetical protein